MTRENIYCKKCRRFLYVKKSHWWSSKAIYTLDVRKMYLNSDGGQDHYCENCEAPNYTTVEKRETK